MFFGLYTYIEVGFASQVATLYELRLGFSS
jgi:hypothetical protein